jgi:predicted RNA binding protein YcfA (HicA-like mRNA interferase family)
VGFVTTAEEIMAFLASKGYHRETGGRHGVKMAKGGNRIPIPAHKGSLPRGTAQHILEQAGHTVNDLIDWRR